jgi:hypothetical protein
MISAQRLNEAIKQTELALEDIDHPDTRQQLEQGLDSLKRTMELLDDSPRG